MSLTSDQIKELNAQYSDGAFFEALVIVRDQEASPLVKDYLANYPEPFELDGNAYLTCALQQQCNCEPYQSRVRTSDSCRGSIQRDDRGTVFIQKYSGRAMGCHGQRDTWRH